MLKVFDQELKLIIYIVYMVIPVAAAIIKKDNKYMIAKRSIHKHLGGFWEFPGGKIEVGESAEDCLVRELEEELSIEVKVLTFLAENYHDYGHLSIQLKAYLCTYIKGEILLVDHDEIKWVTLEQLINIKLAPADIPFLEFLDDSIEFSNKA